MTAAHSHTGLFVDRSHTSSSLGFIKAVCSKVQVVTKRNSKCRNGERGMPAAKRKAQVILCVLPSIFATQMACRSCRSGAWNCGELPQEKSRAPNCFGALLHATLMRQVLRMGKQAQTAEASCTCTCTSSSCCCGSSSCTPFLKFRSAPGWLQCLQYTPLLRECQHFRCTFMHEKCKFDKLHKPTGLAGYGLAKNLQK